MNEKRARMILKSAIRTDNSLCDMDRYLYWNGRCIHIDADFTVEELEAIVWWVKHKTVIYSIPNKDRE